MSGARTLRHRNMQPKVADARSKRNQTLRIGCAAPPLESCTAAAGRHTEQWRRPPDQAAWFERLEVEPDNLLAALDFRRRETNLEAELRLVGALALFWGRTRHDLEGRARIDGALSRTDQVSPPAERRARVLACERAGRYVDGALNDLHTAIGGLP
jgi:hypothetical protein